MGLEGQNLRLQLHAQKAGPVVETRWTAAQKTRNQLPRRAETAVCNGLGSRLHGKGPPADGFVPVCRQARLGQQAGDEAITRTGRSGTRPSRKPSRRRSQEARGAQRLSPTHMDSSQPGPMRSLLAEVRDEVSARFGDFQAQIQGAVNHVNEKVEGLESQVASASSSLCSGCGNYVRE